MSSIRVIVAGGTGRTGGAVLRYLAAAEDIKLVGVLARTHAGKSLSEVMPDLALDIPICSNVSFLLDKTRPHVFVDFSSPEAARRNFTQCVHRSVHPIIGATGLGPTDASHFAKLCKDHSLGGALIPNFSLGASALMEAAKVLSKYFADISLVETYPHTKKDIPSGTSVRMLEELAKPPHLKGGEISIHSIRISGVVSHQELMYGGSGETISLIHQVVDRQCFGPGVLQTIRRVQQVNHLVTELAEVL